MRSCKACLQECAASLLFWGFGSKSAPVIYAMQAVHVAMPDKLLAMDGVVHAIVHRAHQSPGILLQLTTNGVPLALSAM